MILHKSNKSKNVARSRDKLKIKATVYHLTRDESFYLTEYRTVDGAKKTKLRKGTVSATDYRRRHIAEGARRPS
jgi:hypothetical protein